MGNNSDGHEQKIDQGLADELTAALLVTYTGFFVKQKVTIFRVVFCFPSSK